MFFNTSLSNLKSSSDFTWKIFTFFCLVLIILASSNEVFADSPASGTDPFGDSLCNVVKALNGNIAKAIATAAIFATAIGFFSGKLQWQTVAVLSVGIVTIFSAGTLVSFLSGSNSAAGACS
jgi:type IV secretory pathway VirB2 component (pilin)